MKIYCGRCKIKKNLTKCSSCKTVYYCGKLCQKLSMKSHNHLCTVLQHVREQYGDSMSTKFNHILDEFAIGNRSSLVIREMSPIDYSIKIEISLDGNYIAKFICTDNIIDNIEKSCINDDGTMIDILGNVLNVNDIKSFSNKYETFVILCPIRESKHGGKIRYIAPIPRPNNWLPDLSN